MKHFSLFHLFISLLSTYTLPLAVSAAEKTFLVIMNVEYHNNENKGTLLIVSSDVKCSDLYQFINSEAESEKWLRPVDKEAWVAPVQMYKNVNYSLMIYIKDLIKDTVFSKEELITFLKDGKDNKFMLILSIKGNQI